MACGVEFEGEKVTPLSCSARFLHAPPFLSSFDTACSTTPVPLYYAPTLSCDLSHVLCIQLTLVFPLQPLRGQQPAVTRECWDCGCVCADCASFYRRNCHRCKSSYCIAHNTGCDEKTVCDSCDVQLRRGYKMRRLMMIDLL